MPDIQTHKVSRIAKHIYPELRVICSNEKCGTVFLGTNQKSDISTASCMEKSFNCYKNGDDFVLALEAYLKLFGNYNDSFVDHCLYMQDGGFQIESNHYVDQGEDLPEEENEIVNRHGEGIKEVICDALYAVLKE